MGAIKGVFTAAWDAIKTVVSNAVNGVKNILRDKLNEANEVVTNVLGKIKDKFKEIFDKVKDVVKNAIDKIKGFFDFEWSLPKLKLPHPKIEGEFSLNPPSVPHFSIDWYKKAMNDPILMTKPTAFGINNEGQIMAGGEAGDEVVSGAYKLKMMISDAVAEQNEGMITILSKILDAILAIDENMGGNRGQALERGKYCDKSKRFCTVSKRGEVICWKNLFIKIIGMKNFCLEKRIFLQMKMIFMILPGA